LSPRELLTLRRSTKVTADRNVRLYLRKNIETRSGSLVFSKEAHIIGPYVLVQLIIRFCVVIVTRLRTGRTGGSDPCMETRLFSSPNHPDWLQGPPINPIQWLPGFFPGGKCPGREIIHSPSSGFEFKNNWSYNCVFSTCLRVMDRENFYRCSRRRLIEIFAFGCRRLFHWVPSDRSEKLI
jgi:hypothetical protein